MTKNISKVVWADFFEITRYTEVLWIISQLLLLLLLVGILSDIALREIQFSFSYKEKFSVNMIFVWFLGFLTKWVDYKIKMKKI